MRFLFVILIVAAFVSAQAQSSITTFILVRHAEKAADGTKDPDLTEQGKQRAVALAKLMTKTQIAAIYATPFKRTQQTVATLALQKMLPVQNYDPAKSNDLLQTLLKENKGDTFLICGHSNTIPAMANYLIGKEEYKTFDDNDYANLLIISVNEKGTAKTTWLTY